MRTIILALILPFFLLPLLLFGQSGAKRTLVPKDVDLQTKIELARELPGLQSKLDMDAVEAHRQALLSTYKLHWYAIELENDANYWANVETDKLLIEFENGYSLNTSEIATFLADNDINTVIRKARHPRIQNWAQLACTDCTPADVTALAKAAQKVSGIKVLEPTAIFELHNCDPNDTFYNDQWGPEAINMDSLWCYYTGGGVPWLAVLDDAIDLEHEDHGNWYEYYDYAEDDTNPRPDSPAASHGTHVGGTTSAILNNNLGVAGMVNDSAYFAKLGDVNDNLSSAGIIDAVNAVAARSSYIFTANMSYGGGGQSAVNENAYKGMFDRDQLAISSSGNDDGPISRPASYAWVQSCGAMGHNGSTYFKASYSNFGPQLEIMAPGGSPTFPITSTTPDDTYNASTADGGPWNGTSFASPHATGLALMLKNVNPGLGGFDVRSILNNTAIDFGDPGLDNVYGNGMVNAIAAAREACAQFELGITDDGTTLSNTAADLSNFRVEYQWMRDGQLIPGATAQSYLPAQPGTYSLMAITPGNCVTTTDGVTKTSALSVGEDQLGFATRVFPIPASGVLNIQHSAPINATLEVVLTDLSGRQLIQTSLNGNGALQTEQFDISNLSAGIYLVSLQTETARSVSRISVRD